MVLAMLAGMPAMVRSRFSTPTIGREWMIGEEGVAATAVDPDGTVLVRDAPWRARTNRATPIADGDPVRVAVDRRARARGRTARGARPATTGALKVRFETSSLQPRRAGIRSGASSRKGELGG